MRDVAVLVLATVMGIAVVVAMTADAARSAEPAERAVPQCTNGHLTATYRGGDAAMSHLYGRIVLRNTSDVACWVKGYGGLSYVGGATGPRSD